MFEEGQYHIKPIPPMYSLHNLQVQLSGFHTLIFDLKTDRVSEFPISFGKNSILQIQSISMSFSL